MDIILYANVLPICFAYQAEFWKNHPAQAAVQAAEKHGGSLGPWSRSSHFAIQIYPDLSRSIQIYPDLSRSIQLTVVYPRYNWIHMLHVWNI